MKLQESHSSFRGNMTPLVVGHIHYTMLGVVDLFRWVLQLGKGPTVTPFPYYWANEKMIYMSGIYVFFHHTSNKPECSAMGMSEISIELCHADVTEGQNYGLDPASFSMWQSHIQCVKQPWQLLKKKKTLPQ